MLNWSVENHPFGVFCFGCFLRSFYSVVQQTNLNCEHGVNGMKLRNILSFLGLTATAVASFSANAEFIMPGGGCMPTGSSSTYPYYDLTKFQWGRGENFINVGDNTLPVNCPIYHLGSGLASVAVNVIGNSRDSISCTLGSTNEAGKFRTWVTKSAPASFSGTITFGAFTPSYYKAAIGLSCDLPGRNEIFRAGIGSYQFVTR